MIKFLKFIPVVAIALAALTACGDEEPETPKPDKPDTPVTPVEPDDEGGEFADDDELLDYIQKVHFNYMWDGAEPVSGLAHERIHLDSSEDFHNGVLTTGGSGFGIAGIITAIHRGFISRDEGRERLQKIVAFLGKADRYHGVWPHWMSPRTGTTVPFSTKDNGADLVESSFLMQGLLIAREYFKNGSESEQKLASDIDKLWKEMEFDWFTRDGQDVIYWHWSPNYAWDMNMPVRGYNECMIVYILAASSPTHSITADVYHQGWAQGGGIKSGATAYGLPLVVKHAGAEGSGGPLFWAHYSWIGLCPKGLSDQYANYWDVTRNHAMINYKYCVANPRNYKGYGADCWGLTASYSPDGYSAHSPGNDLGVIAPTAALSSFPYTPDESMAALKGFMGRGSRLMGKFGFFDAFCDSKNWYPQRYLAIDQLTIAPMIENYRSGLLWNLFMEAPEIQQGLQKLGFTYTKSN